MNAGRDTRRPPLVVMLHGYTGRKELVLAQAYNLAINGMFVVLPDAYGHGDRNPDGKTCDFFAAIRRTSAEINGLMEAYSGRDDVDAARLGLVGYSMGGCIIFDYLAHESVNAAAAATVIATPDWASIMKEPEAAVLFQSLGLVQDAEEMKLMAAKAAAVQPTSWDPETPRIPLLIQNGEADTLVPISGVKEFYESVRRFYADPTQIELIAYPGIGHGDTLDMNLRISGWFQRFLFDGKDGSGEPLR